MPTLVALNHQKTASDSNVSDDEADRKDLPAGSRLLGENHLMKKIANESDVEQTMEDMLAGQNSMSLGELKLDLLLPLMTASPLRI